MTRLSHTNITTNGVRLHVVRAGKGPLVLLLHGFPDFWYSWRHQIEALAMKFTVVAPDLRGYGKSEKPEGIAAYDMRNLVRDVIGLLDALGRKRAHIVGHDWGGVVAWWLGMMYPYRVDRLAILNAPHPISFSRELRTLRQLYRSWYMLLFQLPWLPEELLSARNFYRLRKAIRAGFYHPDRISEADLNRCVDAMSKPGALTAALNYYRAAARSIASGSGPKPAPIPNPTSLIWGERDRALGKRLTLGLETWVEDLSIHYIPDCGHWPHQEEPERVSELLLAHLLG